MNKFIVNIAKIRNHFATRLQGQMMDSRLDRYCMIFREFVFYLYQFFTVPFLWNRFRLKVNNMVIINFFESLFNIVGIGSQRANCFPQFFFKLPIPSQVLICFYFSHNRGADRRRGPCRQAQLACADSGVRSSALFRRKAPGQGTR